jgi:hypothetical protein
MGGGTRDTMSKRRVVLNSSHISTVKYPSALFSLEKDEIFPYERYAYAVLSLAVEALHAKQLPAAIEVDFTDYAGAPSPWMINASIRIDLDSTGSPSQFHFSTPQLVPAILYLFAARLMAHLVEDERFEQLRDEPMLFGRILKTFVDGASEAVRGYKQGGLGTAVRSGYEYLGLTMTDLAGSMDAYDLLTRQLAYHEVAHAYVQQVTHRPNPSTIEQMSFELIADLMATMWLYHKMIANTPDDDEYRKWRGLESYRDTIVANALMTLRSQQALIILMAIAGAQRTRGAISLDGGSTHPPGLQRYMIQHFVMYTLITSNFATVLSRSDFEQLENDWDLKMDVLTRAGVIPLSDIERMLDPSECDTLEAAANLIEDLGIRELECVVPTLRDARHLLRESLRRKTSRSRER